VTRKVDLFPSSGEEVWKCLLSWVCLKKLHSLTYPLTEKKKIEAGPARQNKADEATDRAARV
jgi:hypothetical protein